MTWEQREWVLRDLLERINTPAKAPSLPRPEAIKGPERETFLRLPPARPTTTPPREAKAESAVAGGGFFITSQELPPV